MTNLKYFFSAFHKNDDGSVIIPTLMVLVLVTIIGVMSIRTSSNDINISTNQQLHERSFYAAESARAFIRNDPVLYGKNNIIARGYVGFPKVIPSPTSTPLSSPADSSLSVSEQMIKDTPDLIATIQSLQFNQILFAGTPPTPTITVRPPPPPALEGTSFRGSVEYLTSTLPPRGSGFAVVKFRAHNYRMVCEGHFSGVSDTASRIEAGFYRIGF